jgi:hypothetical protein
MRRLFASLASRWGAFLTLTLEQTMIIFSDRSELTAALAIPLPAELRSILAEIVAHASETGLLELTYVVILESGDTEHDIAEVIGFSPLTNPIDSIGWKQRGFHPYWACLRLRGGWFELIHTVSNDGFAFILLIGADGRELARMCEYFTTVAL